MPLPSRAACAVAILLMVPLASAHGGHLGGPLFSSGPIAPSESFSYFFAQPGAYAYHLDDAGAEGLLRVGAGGDVPPNGSLEVRILEQNGTVFLDPRTVFVASNTTIVWMNEATQQHEVVSVDHMTVEEPSRPWFWIGVAVVLGAVLVALLWPRK